MHQSSRLRTAGADIDVVTRTITANLQNVGRSSGANRSLTAIVDDLYCRAADLDGRAAMLDTYHSLFGGLLPYPSALASQADPTRQDHLTARVDQLRAEIDHWPGTDNDPKLDLLVSELERAKQALRSELERAYRAAVATQQMALGLTGQGAWADSMYDASVTDASDLARTMARLDGIEIDTESVWAVGQAMAEGRSPAEVALPEFLFPSEYVLRMTTRDELQVQQARAERLLASTRSDIQRLDLEQYSTLSSTTGSAEHRSYTEIFDDLEQAWSREQELGTELRDLERRIDDLGYPATTQTITDTLISAPGLTDPDRGALTGQFLADLWPDFDDWSIHPGGRMTEISTALPVTNSFATSTFFQALGVEQTSLIPAYVHGFGIPPSVLSTYVEAMGSASRTLPTNFGADVIQSFGEVWQGTDLPFAIMDARYYGAVAELFASPTIDFPFLLNTYDASESTFAGYYEVHRVFGLETDPRSMLLEALQERPEFTIETFMTEQRAGNLFDDYYADGGLALARILTQMGDSEPTPELRRSVGLVIRSIVENNQALQPMTAIGGAMMVNRDMGIFLPSNTWNADQGSFVSPLELEYRDIPRIDIGVSQTDLRIFLERVMREPTASDVVLESTAIYVHESISAFETPADIYADLDELGLLMGYVADIAGDLAVEDGFNRDDSNALKAAIVGSLAKIAVTGSFALIPAGSLVVLAGKAIGSGAVNFGVGRATNHFFPTDAELDTYKARLDEVTGIDLRSLQASAIASAYDDDPTAFNHVTMPAGLLVDGHLLRPGDQLEYHGTSAETMNQLWDTWLLAGVTTDADRNAALRWANEAMERLYADANSRLFGDQRPVTSN